MSEKLEALLDNEKEWRRYMMKKVDKIDDQLDGLKLKVAGVGSLLGFISGIIGSHIKELLK